MNEKTRKRLTVERIVELLGRNVFFLKEHPFRKWKNIFWNSVSKLESAII